MKNRLFLILATIVFITIAFAENVNNPENKPVSIQIGNDNPVYVRTLNPDINQHIPNTNNIKDMNLATLRVVEAIKKNQKIGIIADYDVDGSTSASILYKFLKNYNSSIILKIPNRLIDGYGPNIKLMNEMLNKKVELLFHQNFS